jgi:phosphatidylglycerol:prolipoprotein diacylglycerol transferase
MYDSAPDLVFPHLGLVITHLARSLTVFGFEIYFYGITIALGMLCGLFMVQRMMKLDGEDPEPFNDFVFFAIICGLVGARAYYVIFSWDAYRDDLLSIFNLRQGGLAVFGGVLGGIIALLIFTRRRKMSFFYLADYGAFGLLTGQILGRWGNFFNTEAFGGYTDGPLAMQIRRAIVSPNMISPELDAAMALHPVTYADADYIQVHPTFFYESCWNLALLVLLILYLRRKKFSGEIAFLYFVGEGLGRFWVESLRTDSLLAPGLGLPVSQVLSVIFVLSGVYGIVSGRRRVKNQSDSVANK